MGSDQSIPASSSMNKTSMLSDNDGGGELPYIPYTVNAPIGNDSPKKKKNSYKFSSSSSKLNFSRRSKNSKSTMVIIPKKDSDSQSMESDPELLRLKNLPSFLPIMRASINSSAKDPDILERLDLRGIQSLTNNFQAHLINCTNKVTHEQKRINFIITSFDQNVTAVLKTLEAKKKLYSKATSLKSIDEINEKLKTCKILLDLNIAEAERLNNDLPTESKLLSFNDEKYSINE